jgi:anti-sigma B factor antagonist
MQIQSHESGDVFIISPTGSIDAMTTGNLTTFLAQHNCSRQIVLDLAQVDFMSSAGLRMILATAKEARQNEGDLRIAAPQAGVLKTLKMAGFTNIVKTFGTVEEAVQSYA